jgi:hypothetical protein
MNNENRGWSIPYQITFNSGSDVSVEKFVGHGGHEEAQRAGRELRMMIPAVTINSIFSALLFMSIYKPYNLLLLAGLAFLITSFFIQKRTIDIHVHDTMYVLAGASLLWFAAIGVYALYGVYLLTNKFLFSCWLTWLHVVLTILALTIVICFPLFATQRRYLDLSSVNSYNRFSEAAKIIQPAQIAFLFAQVLLVVNIVAGMVKRVVRSKN